MPTSSERFRQARALHMGELTARPGYRRNLLLCSLPGAAVIVVCLALGKPLVALAGLGLAAIGPAVYYWSLRSRASSVAEGEVMHAWAREHGWTYLERLAPPADVRFCAGRQKPACEDGFQGTMCGLPGLIFNFTYSTYETRTRTVTGSGGATHTETYQEEVKHRHAVLRLTLGPIAGLPSMSLAPAGFRLFERVESALGSSRLVDTESAEFNDRFKLTVADAADQTVVMRIFQPALLVRLVDGAFLQTAFQYEGEALAFVWDDQYDVEQLEEVEARIAAAEPLTHELVQAARRLRPSP